MSNARSRDLIKQDGLSGRQEGLQEGKLYRVQKRIDIYGSFVFPVIEKGADIPAAGQYQPVEDLRGGKVMRCQQERQIPVRIAEGRWQGAQQGKGCAVIPSLIPEPGN